MKNQPQLPQEFTFTSEVYEHIKNTIGSKPPETGGLLGGDRARGMVTHFYYDTTSCRSGAAYTPDIRAAARVLKEWNDQGVRLIGVVHSHPSSFSRPSGADCQYVERILQANRKEDMRFFLTPIVESSAGGGRFKMNFFVASLTPRGLKMEQHRYQLAEDEEHPIEESSSSPPDFVVDHGSITDRIETSYSLDRMAQTRVICIGVGGSSGFVENLARCTVKEFVLIDPDIVSVTNLATQHHYRRDLGRAKVDALADRILDINPQARVVSRRQFLDDIDDTEFSELACEPLEPAESLRPQVSLIAACTDSFAAQARANRLALHFGLPLIAAQVYEEGRGAEVMFTHPKTSRACARCISSARYRAYLEEGFENDVTSAGSPISTTSFLNATCEFIALAIIHYGTDNARWGQVLTRIGNRNLAQLRTDPDIHRTLGLPNFEEAFRGVQSNMIFANEVIWREQLPESPETGYAYRCPDCGGSGNLREAAGRFEDTRIMPVTDHSEAA